MTTSFISQHDWIIEFVSVLSVRLLVDSPFDILVFFLKSVTNNSTSSSRSLISGILGSVLHLPENVKKVEKLRISIYLMVSDTS